MTRDNRPYYFITQDGIGISKDEIRTMEDAQRIRSEWIAKGWGAFDIEEYPAEDVEYEERRRAYIREMSMGG